MRKLLILLALVVGATTVLPVSPALAFDDSFHLWTETPSKCTEDRSWEAGGLNYIDYGEGAPGGGMNDDYIEVADFCADGDGVKAWVWLNGVCLQSCAGKYNGLGNWGTVIWDPFPNGQVYAGDVIGVKVCSVDGPNGTPYNCASGESYPSVDG